MGMKSAEEKKRKTYRLVDPMQPILAVEMVGHQDVILQGVLGADRHKRLGRLERRKPLGLASLLPPCILLLEHMEKCHNVAQAADVEPGVSNVTECSSLAEPACRLCRCCVFHPGVREEWVCRYICRGCMCLQPTRVLTSAESRFRR